jgi:hypothetical protein
LRAANRDANTLMIDGVKIKPIRTSLPAAYVQGKSAYIAAPTTLRHIPALALAFAASCSRYTPRMSVTALLVLTITCETTESARRRKAHRCQQHARATVKEVAVISRWVQK